MRVILEQRSGPVKGNKIPVNLGHPLRIGRTSKADQAFPDDKQMSGVHFAVECDEKGCRIRDLNSSNGTFLNGARVKEATLANGDEIRAGGTVFVVRMLPDEALPAPLPRATAPSERQRPASSTEPAYSPEPLPSFPAAPTTPTAPAASPLRPIPLPSFPAPGTGAPLAPTPKPAVPASPVVRLPDLLRKDFQPLYALLDASVEPSVLKVIFESKEEYQSLFEGVQGAQLTHFAPYLIHIPPKSALVDTLVKQAWSKNWGVFLTCDKPLKDLRTHFRQFLVVKMPDGKQVYFRYYDPRVLRLFLPTCLPEEIAQFFGPVKQFLMESEDPKTALYFTRGQKGADKKELHLAPA
jgi:pSer/pThr/pTyr-binding forkhead associated (FHA) protein